MQNGEAQLGLRQDLLAERQVAVVRQISTVPATAVNSCSADAADAE